MQRFEDFYDIRFGEPAEGIASFSYVRVDAFARSYPREFGTIAPRDITSVVSYDLDVLTELLTAYILDVSNEYKIIDVRVIMKPHEQFNESSLLDFFKGNLAMLCIRAGLAIDREGDAVSVYNNDNGHFLSEWDDEIVNHLVGGLHSSNPERHVEIFKERFPSAMVGYVAPDVSAEPPKPVLSFMEQANEQVQEVINYFSRLPFSEIHGDKNSTYDFHNGSRVVVTRSRVTVHNTKGESIWRTKIETTKEIVIDLLRNMRDPKGPYVGERMFRSIAQQLDSSVHDVEIESDVLIAFKLDSKISVRYVGHSIIADFEIGSKRVTAVLVYACDFDAFVAYLEKMLTATKATKWQPE